MRLRIFIRFGLIVSALVVASSASAQEVKVTEKQVPRAVIEAFRKAYPTAAILGYSKEREHGNVYYEIASKSSDGLQTVDILYNPDGTVAEIEESISASELPADAQEVMRTKYANAKVGTIERSMLGSVVTYEVHAKLGKKMIELKFNADGKQVK